MRLILADRRGGGEIEWLLYLANYYNRLCDAIEWLFGNDRPLRWR